jgi:tetratricopeptide (TPR) repeat protein
MADAQTAMNDLEGALGSHGRSLQLRTALSMDFPLNTEYRRLTAVSQYWVGDTLAQLGRNHEALEAYLRCVAIDEELNAADPQLRKGNFSLMRVGNMLDRLGEHQQALGYYRRAQEGFVAEVQADPQNLWSRGGLIEVEAATCVSLAKTAQHAAARATCAEALSLIEQTAVEPTNAVIRAALAGSYATMADGYMAAAVDQRSSRVQKLGYAEAARELYRRSVAIWSDMSARNMLGERDDATAAAASRSLAAAETAVRTLTADASASAL